MASPDNIKLYNISSSGTSIGDTFTQIYMCRDLENGTAGAATGDTLVEQLERANRHLKAQLAETIDSNNKWLVYDRKRDNLVNSLLLKNKDLQQQLDAQCPLHQSEGNSSLQARTSSSLQAGTSSSLQAETSSSLQARTSSSLQAGTSSSLQAGTSSSLQAGTSSSLQAGTSSSLQAGTSSSLQAGTSSSLQAGTSSSLQADTSQFQAELQKYKQKANQEEAHRKHLEKVTKWQQQYIHQLQTEPQRPEDRERIQVLQSQVQVFSEDFQQERNDRERAQGRLSELQVEVELLREQLAQFQQSHMAFLADRRHSTMDAYRDEYHRQVASRQHLSSSPSHLIAHGQDTSQSRLIAHGQCTSPSNLNTYSGLPTDVQLDGHDDNDDDIIDVPMACAAQSDFQTHLLSNSGLECPKCHQCFPVNDPLAFLEHNDKCEI